MGTSPARNAVVALVENIEVLDGRLVGDVSSGGCCHLVENRECVAHSAVGLTGDNGERRTFGGDILAGSHVGQMVDYIVDGDALEIVDLAAG